mgnify:CR=1 FL=1
MSSIENKGKVIYLDNAATTKMSEEVKEAMDPYLEEKFGNASTMYGYGETSRQALEKARKTIAGTLEAKPSEIFFTSGGLDQILGTGNVLQESISTRENTSLQAK